MGKSLKGKPLDRGISQRKDGLYTGRFTNKEGKRIQKNFKKLGDCRAWLLQAQLEDQQEEPADSDNPLISDDPTVTAWFEVWMEEIKRPTVREITADGYESIFPTHIEPVIGDFHLKDIKPIHIQKMLNQEGEQSSKATIRKIRTVTRMLFEAAVENRYIAKSPVTESVKTPKVAKEKKEIRFLTQDEQKRFLDLIEDNCLYENEYRLILHTGLRIGEIAGLKWEDIDFKRKTLHVQRSVYNLNGKWVVSPPKTREGDRIIPLTDEAIQILRDQKRVLSGQKCYTMEFADNVFISSTGTPRLRSNYNRTLRGIAKKMGIPTFSVHSLRHTFATRCLESGMKPKTLQGIMGHADLSITMNLYVHTTDETKKIEMEQFAAMLKAI